MAPLDIERKIPMKVEGASNRVWWYLDGKYIGTAKADSTFFHDVPDGEHVISVADENGRSSSTKVKVFTPGKTGKIFQGDLLF